MHHARPVERSRSPLRGPAGLGVMSGSESRSGVGPRISAQGGLCLKPVCACSACCRQPRMGWGPPDPGPRQNPSGGERGNSDPGSRPRDICHSILTQTCGDGLIACVRPGRRRGNRTCSTNALAAGLGTPHNGLSHSNRRIWDSEARRSRLRPWPSRSRFMAAPDTGKFGISTSAFGCTACCMQAGRRGVAFAETARASQFYSLVHLASCAGARRGSFSWRWTWRRASGSP